MSEIYKKSVEDLRKINKQNTILFRVVVTFKSVICLCMLLCIFKISDFFDPVSVMGQVIGIDLAMIMILGIQMFRGSRLERNLKKSDEEGNIGVTQERKEES